MNYAEFEVTMFSTVMRDFKELYNGAPFLGIIPDTRTLVSEEHLVEKLRRGNVDEYFYASSYALLRRKGVLPVPVKKSVYATMRIRDTWDVMHRALTTIGSSSFPRVYELCKVLYSAGEDIFELHAGKMDAAAHQKLYRLAKEDTNKFILMTYEQMKFTHVMEYFTLLCRTVMSNNMTFKWAEPGNFTGIFKSNVPTESTPTLEDILNQYVNRYGIGSIIDVTFRAFTCKPEAEDPKEAYIRALVSLLKSGLEENYGQPLDVSGIV